MMHFLYSAGFSFLTFHLGLFHLSKIVLLFFPSNDLCEGYYQDYIHLIKLELQNGIFSAFGVIEFTFQT